MKTLALTLMTVALLAPGTAHAATCKLGTLPDKACTPGIARTTDIHMVCPSSKNLPVSASLRQKVFRAYRIPARKQARYSVAPLIPFAIGGSNVKANLFPQSKANAAKLVKLGSALKQSVCNGDIGLEDAQRIVTDDWLSAYRKFFA